MEEKTILLDEAFSRLSTPSLQSATKVIEFIVANPRSTMKKIAQGVGLSYSSVRYILEELLSNEIVRAINYLDEPSSRRRGRPATRFKINKTMLISSPPRQYWRLSNQLIAALLSQLGLEKTERIFRFMGVQAAQSTAENWSRTCRLPMSHKSFRKRLRQELNRMGYNATITLQKQRVVIITQNCIYGEVSRKYQGIVCNYHSTFFPTLLSLACQDNVSSIKRLKCMAHEEEYCELHLELGK